MKKTIKPTDALAPNPVALVSCGSLENSNITTIAWTGIACSDPMQVYISVRPTRKSYEIIKNTQEFVINLPNDKQIFEADFCGTKTGRDTDKFEECGFTKALSTKISAPYIKECPINLECKATKITNLGSHDMILADVLAVNVDEELLDENGNILFEKANLISFAGKKYFSAKEAGDRGICLKKK